MPTYIFTCDCGKTFDEFCSISERKEAKRCECGAIAKRDIGAEQRGGQLCGERGFWNHISESMAVHPSEIQQTVEEDRKMGAMADGYLPDGRLKFRSMSQLRKYQQAHHMIDRNSFYG